MAAKHKTAIQLHLVLESCIIDSSCFRPVRERLHTFPVSSTWFKIIR